MSADDHSDADDGGPDTDDLNDEVQDRLEEEADSVIEQFDQGLIDLLSWLLETETRARIYVHLRQHPESTSEEIAEGTGLYPSTVREELAELHEEAWVTRHKRENGGAGNNPYEYGALPPSELVATTVDEIQSQLNTAFNLDQYLSDEDGDGDKDNIKTDSEPVTISVTDEQENENEDTGTGEPTTGTGDSEATDVDTETETDVDTDTNAETADSNEIDDHDDHDDHA
ncbi:MAG: putative transcriptional regulator [halophilic archaeon J07HX5]|jgi:Sugar-specific transcriptional regulator TrmB.|nr:MAG: putative transcriptional regulator [halophilic archaeon J07HX5]